MIYDIVVNFLWYFTPWVCTFVSLWHNPQPAVFMTP